MKGRGGVGMRGSRWDRALLPTAAMAAATAAFLVHEIYSLDVWWQVVIGQEIVDSLAVPRVDRFAAAALGRPYHDSHWLFQAMLGLAHREAGMIGVQLLMLSAWALTLGLCWKATRRWVESSMAAMIVFLTAMASVERFLPRPEIVTFLGISSFYLLLQQGRHRTLGGVITMLAIQVWWSNCHGLFVIGPFMVACYWLDAVMRGAPGSKADGTALGRLLAGVIAATLVTPFGLGGWRYAVLLLSEVGPRGPEVMRTLGELGGTFSSEARSSPAFWFYLLLLLAAVPTIVLSARKSGVSARMGIVACLAVASFSGRRNIVLFVLVAAPFVAETLGSLVEKARLSSRRLALPAIVLMMAWSAYPLSGAYYLRMEIPARFGLGVTPSFFPHGLPGFLDRIGFEGQVLNSNTLGGFYLYHGFPSRLPLTDGRWEVYDQGVLNSILGRSRHPSEWRSLVAEKSIDAILLAHTSPEADSMLPGLVRDPSWRLVFYDAAASFWLPAESRYSATAIDLSDPSTLPRLVRPEDGLILNVFLDRTAARGLQAANLKDTLAWGIREGMLLQQLGMVQIELGHLPDAKETFERLLERDPTSIDALNELAFVAYRQGDVSRAVTLLEKAVALEPENERVRENLERIRADSASSQRQRGGR